ncbi:CapA family protein [uncultured Imperialibacter sp.]|uniref:CapA family protein n=1 Tax=uncultured Imperialibacter sp. TaxID=1672639 RepID=UPI0030DD28B4
MANLEGMISETARLTTDTPILFNHPSVLDVLAEGNGKLLVGLANNHMLDLPGEFDRTVELLTRKGIIYGGAGRSPKEAASPIVFEQGGVNTMLFNACWDFLLYHQKNPSSGVYLSEINERNLLESVSTARSNDPSATIAIFFHWNFDLETLPFPAHRTFAKALIDNGANVVVGAHSHCVQGGEAYGDGYIIYGLGNFFIPNSTFVNGKLTFPEWSSLQMAFEYEPISNRAFCHWFKYRYEGGHHYLDLVESRPFEDSELLKQHSPYYNLTHKPYIKFFKSQRRKKALIPIYENHQHVIRNKVKTEFLKKRAGIARLFARLGLVKWQS